MKTRSFQPSVLLKNPYIQSIFASKRLGGRIPDSIQSESQTIILDCNDGIKLSGIYTSQKLKISKGCVIIIHGWEGSSESRYAKGTTKFLFHHGYDIFRLNLRDHGETHHLNKGLFFITMFNEVFQAVLQISKLTNGNPIYIVGYSLGANYALRIARQHQKTPINKLKHILAISPPINPELSTARIDQISLFKYYFLKKWKRSLQKKQHLFPNLYNFNEILSMSSIMSVTEALVKDYSGFTNAKEYFEGYTLLGNALNNVCTPTTIITAADDPIIPVNDFYQLTLNNNIQLIVHKYGGHLGFLEKFLMPPWFDSFMAELFLV